MRCSRTTRQPHSPARITGGPRPDRRDPGRRNAEDVVKHEEPDRLQVARKGSIQSELAELANVGGTCDAIVTNEYDATRPSPDARPLARSGRAGNAALVGRGGPAEPGRAQYCGIDASTVRA